MPIYSSGFHEGLNTMELEQLKFMKAHMARRGNWKEVERINKMIAFNAARNARTAKARARRK